ncbi:MAG: polyprenol monophosphomannose synthase [Polyangiaceae bacterium]|nr:polyprenol monophosphomannose synthase [Polyangiaceae bacterium]
MSASSNSTSAAAGAVPGERTLIVTPTYNERDNIEAFASSVFLWAPGAHLLIVDDNSPDGTGDLADELARRDPRVRVMHRSKKLGLGTAYVSAFKQALRQGYDYFIEMDADHSHNPQYLPDFFAAFKAGADVIVGSRNIAGGGIEGWGLDRHILSKGGSLYSRTILGVEVRDLTTGYKGFTRQALEAIDLSRVDSNGYSFQIEMTFRALNKGLKVVEVPIVFVDRELGRSKMNRRIFAEAVLVVWKLRWAALRKRL